MEQDLFKIKNRLLKEMEKNKIDILGIEETIIKIKNEKKSIARFGDGELDLIIGKNLKFQRYNQKLGERLEEILKTKQDFCLLGIPDVISKFDNLTEESEAFWIKYMDRTRKVWVNYIHNDMTYCTANLTRLYIRHKDRSKSGKYFSMLKDIWKDRDVVICEGEQTRIGIGNDLLDKCKSIKRIICPSEDAFNVYDKILNTLKKEDKSVLILIALGPSATVLAYDLAKEGYQALDIGHFDIEYEWYLRNAVKREKIENKYTNEVDGGNETEEINDVNYENQIKEIIK